MKELTVYSALYPWFAHLDTMDEVKDWKTVYLPKHLEKDNALLLLHGGADISPSIYGEKANKHVYNDELSNRDAMEIALFTEAVKRGIPIVGICRGAQLACALAGGKLYQHVTGHNGGEHRVTTIDGERFKTTSAHHQMMNPSMVNHEILAWSSVSLSKEYIGEEDQKLPTPTVEPEIVFFPQIKTLGIQGHPEWMKVKTGFVQHILKLISEKLL